MSIICVRLVCFLRLISSSRLSQPHPVIDLSILSSRDLSPATFSIIIIIIIAIAISVYILLIALSIGVRDGLHRISTTSAITRALSSLRRHSGCTQRTVPFAPSYDIITSVLGDFRCVYIFPFLASSRRFYYPNVFFFTLLFSHPLLTLSHLHLETPKNIHKMHETPHIFCVLFLFPLPFLYLISIHSLNQISLSH